MERAAYRIIDANFNRGREALRGREECCRFALNSASLTAQTKQLRHELSAAVAQLDEARLIASRDIDTDVGRGNKAGKQMLRQDLNDCFTAACKRLTEALRSLAEMTQIVQPSIAENIEKLRFEAYRLEKDIIIFSQTRKRFEGVRLYVIITSDLPADILFLAGSCITGGADCIQLRTKTLTDEALMAVASEFVKICSQGGVLSIINDRVDVAVAAGADGVHLGQNDLPIAEARKLQSRPLIIGKSTHSLEHLKTACEQRPAYVSLGPVFATQTKPNAEAVGLGYIRQAKEVLAHSGIASVAIGGIGVDNVEEVLKAGAQVIAVCSAVTQARNPAAACRELKKKITAFGEAMAG
ncbi:MAG: thiamine phosphate synthase [Planctomycetota bacterium]|jgi:thiamine-phosphate pyrophosphorylase